MCGWQFAWCYLTVSPPGTFEKFWKILWTNLGQMLKEDDAAYWRSYGAIIAASLRYVGRQLAALFLAVLPVTILLLLCGPALERAWNKKGPLVLPRAEVILPLTPDGNGYFRSDHFRVKLEDPYAKYYLGGEGAPRRQTMLRLLGFRPATLAGGTPDGASLEIIRAYHRDRNPLWPYVNDLELLFVAGMSLGTAFYFIRQRSVRLRGGDRSPLSYTDYLLSQTAVNTAAAMRGAAAWESKRYDRALSQIKIDRPVFITGLARSGTTLLLNILASSPQAGTHRYRDYPFLMTPVLWNRVTDLFGGSGHKQERPHQDGIMIDRDSPEAFEEPLWQQFFAHLHNPDRLQHMENAEEDGGFDIFFPDHIRKILYLRGAGRYVSKGNYNVTRMQYIRRLLPDARFIIPVRHPYDHVQSLVRQHQLFCRYCAGDPRIAEYLQNAGHYEFGPQRIPVNTDVICAGEIVKDWAGGHDYGGYARQWQAIYEYAADKVARTPELRDCAVFVRYEDLTAHPAAVIDALLKFTGLEGKSGELLALNPVSAQRTASGLSAAQQAECWQRAGETASRFGYRESGETVSDFVLSPFMLRGQKDEAA